MGVVYAMATPRVSNPILENIAMETYYLVQVLPEDQDLDAIDHVFPTLADAMRYFEETTLSAVLYRMPGWEFLA